MRPRRCAVAAPTAGFVGRSPRWQIWPEADAVEVRLQRAGARGSSDPAGIIVGKRRQPIADATGRIVEGAAIKPRRRPAPYHRQFFDAVGFSCLLRDFVEFRGRADRRDRRGQTAPDQDSAENVTDKHDARPIARMMAERISLSMA